MTISDTSLNFDSACLDVLKNQTERANLDSTSPVEIRVTLSLDHSRLLLWNGTYEISLEPDGPTGQFLLSALQRLRRKADEDRLKKPVKLPKKKSKKKNKNPEPITPQIIPENKSFVALSRYKNLGSGQGKILIKEKPKKEKPKFLSVSDL